MLEETLTKNELQSLNHFLRKKIDAKTSLSLTYTHGFLSAVLTAPTLSDVSYYPLLIDKIYNLAKQHASDVSMDYHHWLFRLTQQINCELRQDASSPLLFESNFVPYKEASWELLKNWSLGYLCAVRLDSLWMRDEHALAMVMPMGILADELDLIGTLDMQGQPITDNTSHKILAREHLLTAIATLYDYWQRKCVSDK